MSDTEELLCLTLDERLSEYSLAECLYSDTLQSIFQRLDYEDFPVSRFNLLCEEFGVTDRQQSVHYQSLKQNFECYFFHLLRDCALKPAESSSSENATLKTLQDLLDKLSKINGCKSICKSVKKEEKEILKDLVKNRQSSNPENLVQIKISIKHPQNNLQARQPNHIVVNYDTEKKKLLSEKDHTLMKSSSSESSVVTNSSSETEQRLISSSRSTKKMKVALFYHANQIKDRIEYFKRKVVELNPCIEFYDISSVKEEELEDELSKENPIFILFDKETHEIIDETKSSIEQKCGCINRSDCICRFHFYRKFYLLVYKMYLDRRNNNRFFMFLMEDFKNFSDERQKFKYKWLLRQKYRGTEKKVYLKPYQVPETNCELSIQFKKFLEDFKYPYMVYVHD